MAKLRSTYIAQRRLVSDLWRTRCESQIALLSLCKALDIFCPPVEFSKRLYPCPFSWWPEGETLPVGYHATTTVVLQRRHRYRTFDSAFALECTAAACQFKVVKMVYQNDLTR